MNNFKMENGRGEGVEKNPMGSEYKNIRENTNKI
jgi:hypothetical protein